MCANTCISELDRPQRQRLIAVLQRRHRVQFMGISLLFSVLTAANILGTLAMLRHMHYMLVDRGFNPSSWPALAASALVFVLISAPGPCLAILIRDLWRRQLVRRFLNKGSCMHCGYSLEALEPEEGTLKCPECGSDYRSPNADVWLPVCVLVGSPERAAAC